MAMDKEYETYGLEDNLMVAILIIIAIILILFFLIMSGQINFQPFKMSGMKF